MMKMPFNQHMMRLLKRSDSHPILKLAKDEEHSMKECQEVKNFKLSYFQNETLFSSQLFQRTVQVIKEKIMYHKIAKEEIEKRATALEVLKKYQMKEMAEMNLEKKKLQENAENLAEKYEEIKEKQEMLLKRFYNLNLFKKYFNLNIIFFQVCQITCIHSHEERSFI